MTHEPGTTATTETWRPRARAVVLWSTLAATALLLTAVALVLSWRADLPDPVASHWGPDGQPDGFASLGGFVGTIVASTAGPCVLFAAIGWFRGQAAATRRIVAGATVWSGAFGAATLLMSLAPQRGLGDAAQAPGVGTALAVSLLAPLVPAAVAAFLVPADPPQAADGQVPADASRLPVADGERVVWLRRIAGGPGVGIGAATTIGMVGVTVALQMWTLLLMPLLLGVLFAAMFAFVVRVDATGLTVRSRLGWPRTHVPAAEIERASVIEVEPMRDFGGWGWRVGRGGRVGVVLRRGEALLVERSGGRSVAVTVDDAAAGAALLNTLAERSR
ncbi:DUF1648 domain-containing protein [Xylanimonas oleitrophica]|uniref:DUF1648 domain-containing protein n=1 Tax=Xylanimonas oleitrophica TaxID=2607479 RepID=A0A2W5Y9B0_9MICO|nr:DUF1648 domain-containing protein [Xylanimonas oleitrophica]PZR55204.1 DUF1648 domain-containing protein [Xylanimonas oleitrophica]